MLRSQQSNLLQRIPPRYRFWALLTTISFVLHLILIGCLFLPQIATSPINVTLSAPSSHVLYLPFYKVAPASVKSAVSATVSAPATSKKTNSRPKKIIEKKVSSSAVSAKVPQPAKKIVSKKQVAAPPVVTPSVPIATVQKIKEPLPRSQPTPVVPEKIKEIAQVEKTIKQSDITPQKTILPKANVIEQFPQETRTQQAVVAGLSTTASTPAPHYVGRDEFAELRMTEEIKLGIAKIWKRPSGIVTKRPCILKVTLTTNNKREIIVQASSGSLAYDVSAKQAALAYQFPKQNVQREIIITM